MTYDPLDTNETDTDADGSLTIDDLTATTVAGLDTSSGSGNAQIYTDGEGGLIAEGYNIPVAFEHLVAWYPFDSATYGGNNADDVTGGKNYYGDSTAYDGTVTGATYQSSGGVTDINAGTNSGAFDFDGSNDVIDLRSSGLSSVITNTSSVTTMAWASVDTTASDQAVLTLGFNRFSLGYKFSGGSGWLASYNFAGVSNFEISSGITTTGTYFHLCSTWDGSNVEFYLDGVSQGTGSLPDVDPAGDVAIGGFDGGTVPFNGSIDDVRVYDTDLTAGQIGDIVDNTKP